IKYIKGITMKNLTKLLMASMLGGILTLGSYKIFLEEDISVVSEPTVQSSSPGILPVSYDSRIYGTNADFTEAAQKSIHGVVHVKNVAVFGPPKSIWEYQMRGGSGGKALRGAGSGVIITPDGYIV